MAVVWKINRDQKSQYLLISFTHTVFLYSYIFSRVQSSVAVFPSLPLQISEQVEQTCFGRLHSALENVLARGR